jgi:hypothetical protein
VVDEVGRRQASMQHKNAEGEYAFLIFDASGAERFGAGATRRGFGLTRVLPLHSKAEGEPSPASARGGAHRRAVGLRAPAQQPSGSGGRRPHLW